MNGETDLNTILKTLSPKLNEGDYVFCTINTLDQLDMNEFVGLFKEENTWTVILNKKWADKNNFDYSYIAAWITLTIHTSLDAVGLTAKFATALSQEGISCNVIAAYYHDHIFVKKEDGKKAINILNKLA